MTPGTYLALAKDHSCVLCGSVFNVSSAHYCGPRQHSYGKGRGVKGNDLISAHLCESCHLAFDQPKTRKDYGMSELFLHAVALTIIRNTNRLLGRGI